jgi:hypothetical protein
MGQPENGFELLKNYLSDGKTSFLKYMILAISVAISVPFQLNCGDAFPAPLCPPHAS